MSGYNVFARYYDELTANIDYRKRAEYFNEIMYDYDPIEIANMIFYGGKFNPNDMYFQFNGYGNLESFNDWEANKEAKMYIDEIVGALIDNIYYIETDEDLIKFIINLLESEE